MSDLLGKNHPRNILARDKILLGSFREGHDLPFLQLWQADHAVYEKMRTAISNAGEEGTTVFLDNLVQFGERATERKGLDGIGEFLKEMAESPAKLRRRLYGSNPSSEYLEADDPTVEESLTVLELAIGVFRGEKRQYDPILNGPVDNAKDCLYRIARDLGSISRDVVETYLDRVSRLGPSLIIRQKWPSKDIVGMEYVLLSVADTFLEAPRLVKAKHNSPPRIHF